jgi:hypothetical protein
MYLEFCNRLIFFRLQMPINLCYSARLWYDFCSHIRGRFLFCGSALMCFDQRWHLICRVKEDEEERKLKISETGRLIFFALRRRLGLSISEETMKKTLDKMGGVILNIKFA